MDHFWDPGTIQDQNLYWPGQRRNSRTWTGGGWFTGRWNQVRVQHHVTVIDEKDQKLTEEMIPSAQSKLVDEAEEHALVGFASITPSAHLQDPYGCIQVAVDLPYGQKRDKGFWLRDLGAYVVTCSKPCAKESHWSIWAETFTTRTGSISTGKVKRGQELHHGRGVQETPRQRQTWSFSSRQDALDSYLETQQRHWGAKTKS